MLIFKRDSNIPFMIEPPSNNQIFISALNTQNRYAHRLPCFICICPLHLQVNTTTRFKFPLHRKVADTYTVQHWVLQTSSVKTVITNTTTIPILAASNLKRLSIHRLITPDPITKYVTELSFSTAITDGRKI